MVNFLPIDPDFQTKRKIVSEHNGHKVWGAAEAGKPQDQFLAFLTPVVRAVSRFLPSWANLWIDPFARNIDQFVLLAVGLACTMSFGFGLEHRIATRATRAWCHITSVIPKKSARWEPFSPIGH